MYLCASVVVTEEVVNDIHNVMCIHMHVHTTHTCTPHTHALIGRIIIINEQGNGYHTEDLPFIAHQSRAPPPPSQGRLDKPLLRL